MYIIRVHKLSIKSFTELCNRETTRHTYVSYRILMSACYIQNDVYVSTKCC